MKILAPLLLLAAFGCSGSDDDVTATPPAPAENIAFEGKPEPAMAATWESLDKKSTLALKADGGANMKAVVATPGGVQNSDVKGEWKMSEGALLFKKEGGEVMRFYATQKDADTLELRRLKDSKIKIVYKRKS